MATCHLDGYTHFELKTLGAGLATIALAGVGHAFFSGLSTAMAWVWMVGWQWHGQSSPPILLALVVCWQHSMREGCAPPPLRVFSYFRIGLTNFIPPLPYTLAWMGYAGILRWMLGDWECRGEREYSLPGVVRVHRLGGISRGPCSPFLFTPVA